MEPRDNRRIVIVGVCASGKTSLVDALRARGYNARQCLQEHSYVPTMCERVSKPDVLIYLHAGLEAVARRRAINYGQSVYQEQKRRLAGAARAADLTIDTTGMTEEDVLRSVLVFLQQGYGASRQGVEHER